MGHLKITAAICAMRWYVFLVFVMALVLCYVTAVFLAIPPADVYTVKGQLYFAVISTIFCFSIGYIFGARIRIN